jgi:hypothetical protein
MWAVGDGTWCGLSSVWIELVRENNSYQDNRVMGTALASRLFVSFCNLFEHHKSPRATDQVYFTV